MTKNKNYFEKSLMIFTLGFLVFLTGCVNSKEDKNHVESVELQISTMTFEKIVVLDKDRLEIRSSIIRSEMEDTSILPIKNVYYLHDEELFNEIDYMLNEEINLKNNTKIVNNEYMDGVKIKIIFKINGKYINVECNNLITRELGWLLDYINRYMDCKDKILIPRHIKK